MPITTEPTAFNVDPAVLAYYSRDTDETTRLTTTVRGQFEIIRVREILERYLPPAPARIADIGGGPGVHATWLQAGGYSVDLLDPIPRHVEIAKMDGIAAVLGDARALPFENASYDLTLLAGPLYHLAPQDRVHALQEAYRVTAPGGAVVAIAVNRYANLFGATIANQLEARHEVVEDILVDGYSPINDRFPQMFYHSPSELHAEFLNAGLSNVDILGLSGLGGWLLVAIDRHFREAGIILPPSLTTTDPVENALAAARIGDDIPDLTAASAQLMAIGYRP